MEKKKGSFGRVSVAIISTLMAAVFFASGLATVLSGGLGYFNCTRKQASEKLNERIGTIYGTMAMANRYDEAFLEDMSQNTNYRFGIIRAKDLEKVDVTNPESYVCTNFDTMPSTNELDKNYAVTSYRENENCMYEWRCDLFGYGYQYGPEVTSGDEADEYRIREVLIDRYIYSIEEGVFYYETKDGFFRVDSVGLPLGQDGSTAYFNYDSSQKAYYNPNPENTIVDAYYITFDALNEVTAASWETWNHITLDGSTYEHSQIHFVGEDYFTESEKEVTDLYYASCSGNVLQALVRSSDLIAESDKDKQYYLIAEANPAVTSHPGFYHTGSILSGDLYEQADDFLDVIYDLRYLLLAIMIVSGITWILTLVWFCTFTGELRKWQKVWIDVETAAMFCLEGCAAACLDTAFSQLGFFSYEMVIVFGAVFVVGDIIFLLWLYDVAKRIKYKVLWKNSLIYFLWTLIKKLCKKIHQFNCRVLQFARMHTSLTAKVVITILVLSILEFIGLYVTSRDLGTGLILWIIYKILICIIVGLALVQLVKLKNAGEDLAQGTMTHPVQTEKMFWELKRHGENLNCIKEGMNKAVEQRMQSERFKTELITNVSHDIKTPLTSIVNYVDLLQKQDIQDAKSQEYIEVLSRQSAKLKKLIEDLIEASKASTGNLQVHAESINLGVFLNQTLGEFEDRMKAANLAVVVNKPEKDIFVNADGRHLWRVVDNLLVNICKYGQPGTRVYIDLTEEKDMVILAFRNISKYELNVTGEELIERFARGDASRHTEGSGLGLSIASSLMDLMNSSLEIAIDGDLFKVRLCFPKDFNL